MLFVTLFAVLASALGGMLRVHTGEKISMPQSFLIMAIAAPLGMAILVSSLLAFMQWRKRKKK
jgi:uncharacterized iron-regulated membrane protein